MRLPRSGRSNARGGVAWWLRPRPSRRSGQPPRTCVVHALAQIATPSRAVSSGRRTSTSADTLYLGNPPARWESIATRTVRSPRATLRENNWSGLAFDATNPSDFDGFIDTINRLPNRAAFYSTYDINGDGTITQRRVGVSAGLQQHGWEPQRTDQLRPNPPVSGSGPQETTSRGLSFFVQDEFRLNRWTFNVGVRTEQWAALRHHGREHLHLRLGVRAAAERGLRHPRRRPSPCVGVLRALLRSRSATT